MTEKISQSTPSNNSNATSGRRMRAMCKPDLFSPRWALVIYGSDDYPFDETLKFPLLGVDTDERLRALPRDNVAKELLQLAFTLELERHDICADIKDSEKALAGKLPVRAQWVGIGFEACLGQPHPSHLAYEANLKRRRAEIERRRAERTARR
jgi:hypothetical protein